MCYVFDTFSYLSSSFVSKIYLFIYCGVLFEVYLLLLGGPCGAGDWILVEHMQSKGPKPYTFSLALFMSFCFFLCFFLVFLSISKQGFF